MRWIPLLFVVASLACTKTDGRGSKLSATLHGKAVAIDTVLATSYGGEAIRLELSPKRIDCDDLKPASVDYGKRITVTIAPLLQPDGSRQWGLSDARVDNVGGVPGGSKLTVAKADATSEVRAEIDLHVERMIPFGGDSRGQTMEPVFDLTGSIHAKGCGVLPFHAGEVPEEKQPDLVASISGKRLEIRGASFVELPLGDSQLLLSTQPHPCSIGVMGADVTFHLPVKQTMATTGNISGNILGSQLSPDVNDLGLQQAGETFRVDADFKTPSGHSILLKGSIRPKRCQLGGAAPAKAAASPAGPVGPKVKFCGKTLNANTTTIQCYDAQVTDVAPLAGLTQVQALALKIPVRDLTPIAGYTKLVTLEIGGSSVSDLRFVAKLESLTTLDIGRTPVSDLSPLVKLPSLKRLYFSNTRVTSLDALSSLTTLEQLGLRDTAVSDLSPIGKLPKLGHLDVKGTAVSDLSPIGKLPELRILNVEGTAVTTLSALQNLSGILMLTINDTSISDLRPLERASQLGHLELKNTAVTDIGPLAKLANLGHLDLSGTKVTDLSPLAKLTRLQAVSLKGTPVSEAQVAQLQKQHPKCRIVR